MLIVIYHPFKKEEIHHCNMIKILEIDEDIC